MRNRISPKLQEKIRSLVEHNQLDEAYKLAGKIFHGDNEIVNEISGQLGRLRDAMQSEYISSEPKLIQVNKIRKALFELVSEYGDAFPLLNSDYTNTISAKGQVHWNMPTEENPILIGFLIDFSYSMYGQAKNISPFLDSLEVSLNELVNSSADALQKNDKDISSKIEIFMVGCGMVDLRDKFRSFFSSSVDEDSVRSLLAHETMPIDAVLAGREAIEESIKKAPKGGLENDIDQGFRFVQQLIRKRNLPIGGLKILFAISDGVTIQPSFEA